MLALENADEILQILDRFTKQKSKDIPPELEEYINYVAKTGDTVYRWPTVQYLFREKLRNVIKDFHDTTASIEDLPQCPNVDQFNYESMKTLLFERFDNFQAAPFTVQRLCELLTDPKKHYTRLDKFMRALEKNILVVSTVEPGRKPIETDDDHFPFIHENDEINKKDRPSQPNGTEHSKEETPSSSVQTTSENNAKNDEKNDTMKEKETDKMDEIVSEKVVESEKSSDKPEPEKVADEKKEVAAPVPETKPVESIDETVTAEEVNVVAKPDETVSSEPIEKTGNGQIEPEIKADKTEESTPIPSEEKKVDEEIKEVSQTAGDAVEIEKPPTPKHARSTSDDEEDDNAENNSNPSAKKIRLDYEEKKSETKTDPEPNKEPVVPEAIVPKEADVLESISTEIDDQKEKELLEDVVNSPKVAEKEPDNEAKLAAETATVESETPKPTEESPATDDLLKTAEPPASIPSDLDFTPDEALNELVSSDILSVIPEQPAAEEIKMSEESANVVEPVAPADEMNVENTETSTEAAETTAMEDAPIKTDVEQMDVDESNSVDAMDL